VWCAQRRLQLNANKTEVLLVGSKHNLTKLSNEDLSFTIGVETVQPSDVVRDLGVWLDSELSLRQHVTKIAASCFYQLRRLRQVRRRAGREVTTRLVLALVISKLDYCNSLLAGLPTSTLNVLQKVQNAAAWLICQLRPRDHVSSSLQRSCVLYKQCILMYRINCGQAPKYITDLVSTVAATATRSGLQSENTTNYCLLRLRTKFRERAFSYAGPAAWNRLPQNIRASTSLNVFKTEAEDTSIYRSF